MELASRGNQWGPMDWCVTASVMRGTLVLGSLGPCLGQMHDCLGQGLGVVSVGLVRSVMCGYLGFYS